MALYSIIPLLTTIVLLLLKKINIKKIVNGLFWGTISLLLTVIVNMTILPIFGFSLNDSMLASDDISLFNFIICLFTAAVPEEVSKLISIKLGSKKEKNCIFINSILIGLTFACIENFMYTSVYGSHLGLTRMLQPGHLFFQILMSLFLIKALSNTSFKKIVFSVLALVLPMFCHAAFNTFNSIDTISYIFYGIGILTYIFTFYCILKLPADNEEYKIKLIGLKIVFIILSTLFIIIFYQQNNNSNINEVQKIQEDNIELKVISSEKVKISDDISVGNYVKVKVELKNNNDVSYIIDMFRIRIVDDLNKNVSYLSFRNFDDSLYEISARETAIGYLYFDDEDHNYTYLIYTAGEQGNTQTYNFNIK